jgi:hypothetical protein
MNTVDTLSRTELYELVWTSPIVQLSKKYGLTDVGLAKICKRHRIPRPGRGYWAKLRHGVADPRTPLPPIDDPNLQRISISELTQTPEDCEARFAADDEVHECIQAELARAPVVVASVLRSPHPLVVNSIADDELNVAEASAAESRRRRPGSQWKAREANAKAYIDVSQPLRSRAYRVMDAVLKAAMERGYEVWGKPEPYRRSTFMKVLGHEFQLRLYEPNLQKPHVMTNEELARKETYGSPFVPRHDYVRSAQLCLQLRESTYSVLWQSRDGQKARVEDRINDLFVAALKRVDRARMWERIRADEERVRREAAERKRLEEERARQAEERRREEQRHVDNLLLEVDNWYRSRRLRSYIRAVRGTLAQKGRMVEEGSPLDKRLRWAEQVAEDLDPMSPPRATPPS